MSDPGLYRCCCSEVNSVLFRNLIYCFFAYTRCNNYLSWLAKAKTKEALTRTVKKEINCIQMRVLLPCTFLRLEFYKFNCTELRCSQ